MNKSLVFIIIVMYVTGVRSILLDDRDWFIITPPIQAPIISCVRRAHLHLEHYSNLREQPFCDSVLRINAFLNGAR